MACYKVTYKENIKGPDLTSYVLKSWKGSYWLEDWERILKNELFRINGFNTIYNIEPFKESEIPEQWLKFNKIIAL